MRTTCEGLLFCAVVAGVVTLAWQAPGWIERHSKQAPVESTEIQGDLGGMVFGVSSGNAVATGDNSIANTGSGNTFSIGPQYTLAKCFHVTMAKVDDTNYRMESVNNCGREIPEVYVLVKFLDSDGARVGVGDWRAHYVAKGERLRRLLPVPAGVVGYSKIVVRKISDDAGDQGK